MPSWGRSASSGKISSARIMVVSVCVENNGERAKVSGRGDIIKKSGGAMAKRLGVGVIGAGFNGRFHIKSFVGVRHADVLGVCSRTIEKAESAAKLARDLGVGEAKAYGSITDMI